MPHVIYRFARDLRLDDHAGLDAAAGAGDVVPLLVLDAALREHLVRSPRRAAFFCAAAAALDAALRERGSQLFVFRGEAGPLLCKVAKDCDAIGVAWSASYDRAGMRADETLQSQLEEAGLRAMAVHDAPVIAPEELTAARPGGEGYRAFGPYYERWRTLPVASHEVPLLLRFAPCGVSGEPLPAIEEFESRERAPDASPRRAAALLVSFLDGAGLQYAIAVGAPLEDRTSHLSAHLSFGTIAARTVVRETLRRCDDPFLLAEERRSLRLFVRSLALRDFFLQLSWHHPHTEAEPLQEKMRHFPFAESHPALDRWREGRTGYPLVDAGMRQLRETGWMHPRVRAVAASFLCFDLGVDWRVGREQWDRLLIEDDPALATGNWQWTAGVGADMAQYPRIYNPHRAARRFDPLGLFARSWVAELAHVPDPYGSPRTPQIELPLFGADGYPRPVVEHETAARAFLQRYARYVQGLDRKI